MKNKSVLIYADLNKKEVIESLQEFDNIPVKGDMVNIKKGKYKVVGRKFEYRETGILRIIIYLK